MDWLYKEDNYNPPEERNTFIEKSIASILRVLSRLEEGSAGKPHGIYKVSPRVKLPVLVVLVLTLSLTRNVLIMGAIGALVLALCIFLKKDGIRKLLSLEGVVFAITLLMLLPSMLMGNMKNSLIILYKVLMTTSAVNVVSLTSKWSGVVSALKMFFIPDIFILVFEITMKYIYLLGRISEDALQALKLRSIGRNKGKYGSLSSIIGNLFLKSREMGDEMYSAMECRGFTGEYGRSRIDD